MPGFREGLWGRAHLFVESRRQRTNAKLTPTVGGCSPLWACLRDRSGRAHTPDTHTPVVAEQIVPARQ